MADNASKSTVEITGDIVAAYLGNNTIGAAQLPELIEAVHNSLRSISDAPAPAAKAAEDASAAEKRGPGRPRKADSPGTVAPEAGPAKAVRRPGRPAGDPAVPVAASITPDYIVCLEDGKQLKMLKRYLNTNYGMTPADYRQKWGLPPDYPMVAENYSKRRSEAAKRFGLGRKGIRRSSTGSS
jgi:predicted transcriptional regulator